MTNRKRESNGRVLPDLVGDIGGTYFTYLRSKATQRALEFSVTKEYLWELFLKQKKCCALSGIPLTITTKLVDSGNGRRVDKRYHTASLDRIDNAIGYIEGNVQWVHKTINMMRRQYSVEEYIYWCNLVSRNNAKYKDYANA